MNHKITMQVWLVKGRGVRYNKRDPKKFSNEEFVEIRIINPDGKAWFVAKDIAEALGYSDTDQAIQMHCKYPKLFKPVELSGSEIAPRGMYFIPESGMYRLIMRSNLPKTEKFQDWVVEQVLPSIRKNGGYVKGQEHLSDDDLMEKAITVVQRKIKEKELALQEAIRTTLPFPPFVTMRIR
jgi:anti-repressor protein